MEDTAQKAHQHWQVVDLSIVSVYIPEPRGVAVCACLLSGLHHTVLAGYRQVSNMLPALHQTRAGTL